jgi:hypothetical protein
MKVSLLIAHLKSLPADDEVELILFNDDGEPTFGPCEGISYDRGQVSLINAKGDLV